LTGVVRLKGEIAPPPDKSISHRAIMFASLAEGKSVIRNFLRAGDTMNTLSAMRSLGVDIIDDQVITVRGGGRHGLREPVRPIECGNSGTTMRLLAGVLSGNPFFSVLSGDESLNGRPMERVIRPLKLMGSHIMARSGDKFPPIAVWGGGLKAFRHEMPVPSAQVKSAILLAGLYAEGTTAVIETVKSRDHTERMLAAFGADLKTDGLEVTVAGGDELRGIEMTVPGDFSSAAFFIVAALAVKGSDIILRGVGVNPSRTGFLDVLGRMGAGVEVLGERRVSGEAVADLRCRASELRGVDIGPDMVPSMIDEFPVFCVLAAQADGVTSVTGAGELRVKESDRIRAMAEGLKKMGARVEELEDGIRIEGGAKLKGAEVDSCGDHRVAMSFAVAALKAEGTTRIRNAGAVDISFPGFFDLLRRVTV
jgi:3-phosphoshikimate 1-carboxyvinyltransferase